MSVGYAFDPIKHVHTLDGKNLYGVTSVLKNWGDAGALINWAAVCEAFKENLEGKPCVNHIDGNTQNNTLGNLEWCTYKENEVHSFRVLGKKPNRKGALGVRGIKHATSKPVAEIDRLGNIISVYGSAMEADRAIGSRLGGVKYQLLGYSGTTHGRKFIRLTREQYDQATRKSIPLHS